MKINISDIIRKNKSEKTLFVLWGFRKEDYHLKKISLSKIIENKLASFITIVDEMTEVISFEEFLILQNFILDQYKKVVIIKNNCYLHLFPLIDDIEEKTCEALTLHFDEEAPIDTEIGDISEYLNIFSNFEKVNDEYICCYNYSEMMLENKKISIIEAFSDNKEMKKTAKSENIINICSELDYYVFIKQLETENNHVAVICENYIDGENLIINHLKILPLDMHAKVALYKPPMEIQIKKCPKRVREIMRQYWEYNSFRSILFYDLNALEKSEKRTILVSQENIITDLIEQTENCINHRNYKDIFVTAPTGSGKSLLFQLPAIYLAEKYDLVTLVITPLISLMNDQVGNLKAKGYNCAQTINSDISPIIKERIINDVIIDKCHVLYLSPETLMGRSDIEQLIGKRKIGMVIVDEAHIVSTWGKQFRPDYWYLGDHIQKLRKLQERKEGLESSFVIATFTATAIYEGLEDMYHETLNSLHMNDCITYLGYVKRNNIEIKVQDIQSITCRNEYELKKFQELVKIIKSSILRHKKVLIYFPTVALVNRFESYCLANKLEKYIAKYHGQLNSYTKQENFQDYKNGVKLVMLATKAFGMGIDIPDIAVISHFAPTGNVCDYMQEIGRAARNEDISGQAIYDHMNNDFKYINQFHGLSTIKRYQLIGVIKKIRELYIQSLNNNDDYQLKKRRNEILVDADNFSYLFEGPMVDENNMINKVKTAMLLIEKDYERKGYLPFTMRPIPLFAFIYFQMDDRNRKRLETTYPGTVELVNVKEQICKINLKSIWEKRYRQNYSFPKFKYLIYSNDESLPLNNEFQFKTAAEIELDINENADGTFYHALEALKTIFFSSSRKSNYVHYSEMTKKIENTLKCSSYKANSIIDVVLAALNTYCQDYSSHLNEGRPYTVHNSPKKGETSYRFNSNARNFFGWLNKTYDIIKENKTKDNKLYLVDDLKNTRKQIITVLGILEAIGMLTYKSLGGSNSQIYIYVNTQRILDEVSERPGMYQNKLLDKIGERHKNSVKMMTFLFENNFDSSQIWDYLEDYFVGIIPEEMEEDNTSES